MTIGESLAKLAQVAGLSQGEIEELHRFGDLAQSNNQIIPGWIKPGSTQLNPDRIKARLAEFDLIKIWNGAVQTGKIDGNLFLGEDISDPAKAGFHVFSTAQTYNGEAISAGSVMMGNNSSTKPNLFWDALAAKLQMRLGTIVTAELGTSRGFSNVGVKVRRTSAYPVAHNTNAYIPWTEEQFDDLGFWEGITNPSRFTIPAEQGGSYIVGCNMQWEYNATQNRAMGFMVNRTDNVATTANDSDHGAVPLNLVTMLELDAADYIEVVVQQLSGDELDVVLWSDQPSFWMYRIR